MNSLVSSLNKNEGVNFNNEGYIVVVFPFRRNESSALRSKV